MMAAIAAPVSTWASAELVRFSPQSHRTTVLINALTQSARRLGVPFTVSDRPQDAAWTLLWGPGAPDRVALMNRQRLTGGHVIAFDLAYWDRFKKVRVSIDAPHPQAYVMAKDWPAERFQSDPIAQTVCDRWNPSGPILVAGIGPKATTQYGDDVVASWERAQIARCQARWARPIHYRFKKQVGALPAGTRLCATAQPIETVLAGCSLVITWHSNVAVDAIRLGIPVVCRDGAAAAIFPSQVDDHHVPLSLEVRERFLQNLAWFQWNPETEAVQMWRFLREVLA